ncbi:MAG: methylmalonyl-CoA mutase family protein [Anderseniella sp.]|jgi:methylmalonyl-CoA mutase|nr:methylmalonyl-CoA mutase family protein [Anderseniella sp.]
MSELQLASGFPAMDEAGWRALVEASLKGRPFETLRSRTADGIVIEPVYGRTHDAPALPAGPAREIAGSWTLVQRADMPDLAAANTQMLDDLTNGATGIALVIPGSVTAGAHGVAISDARSVERVFDGVELDFISLRLDGGRNGRDLALLVLDEYKRRLLDLSRCRLDLGLDPLGALALNGRIVNRKELASRAGDMFAKARKLDHKGGVFCADARVHHGAGCSEAQELALALATGVDYLRLLEEAGIDPAISAPQTSMLLTADADQFLTIAKLRAARLLWARMLEASGLETSPLTLHAETAMRMMSRRDPHVNLLRTTSAAFAAGIGGADSVTVLPFTAALGLPDGFARRLARNIQNLILEESRAGRVTDAAAGSGYVETLTGELARAAWDVFQQIEQAGGMMAFLAAGKAQALIGDVRAHRNKDIARRKMALTGVSEFPNLNEAASKVLDMALPEDWSIGTPWQADMVECEPLAQHRLAEGFETLRDASDAHLKATGKRPQVFLATLGTPADFTVRATWMTNLLAAGGIEAVAGAVQDFQASGLDAACICSSDAIYATEAEATARTLAGLGASHVMMAGKPGNIEQLLAEAGVGEFVHAGQDVLALLGSLHERLGVRQPETRP